MCCSKNELRIRIDEADRAVNNGITLNANAENDQAVFARDCEPQSRRRRIDSADIAFIRGRFSTQSCAKDHANLAQRCVTKSWQRGMAAAAIDARRGGTYQDSAEKAHAMGARPCGSKSEDLQSSDRVLSAAADREGSSGKSGNARSAKDHAKFPMKRASLSVRLGRAAADRESRSGALGQAMWENDQEVSIRCCGVKSELRGIAAAAIAVIAGWWMQDIAAIDQAMFEMFCENHLA